jgi:hypothetical protein
VVPVVVVPVVVVPVVVVPVPVAAGLTGLDGAVLSLALSPADAAEDVVVLGVVDVVVVVVAAGTVEVVVVAAGVVADVAIGAWVTAAGVAAAWALGRIASSSCSGERWLSSAPASLASIRASRR